MNKLRIGIIGLGLSVLTQRYVAPGGNIEYCSFTKYDHSSWTDTQVGFLYPLTDSA